jgi:activator of 2-hydroxyglutaryl-CoA dehydratase
MKNQAMAYLTETKSHAGNTKLAAELEAIKARNEILEEDLKLLKTKAQAPEYDDAFGDMTTEQLREFITTHTGLPPQGNVSRKTLVRMASDARPERAA